MTTHSISRDKEKLRYQSKRYRFFHELESRLEIPMFVLAFIWLWLFVQDITGNITPFQKKLVTTIWILFIVEFLIKLIISEDRLDFLKKNWLTTIAIFIPALRAFRLLRALTILRGARVLTSLNFVRALTSGRRVISEIREAQGALPEPVMNIGVLIMYSLGADKEELKKYGTKIIEEVLPRMQEATGLQWQYNFTTPVALNSDDPRRATDFLKEASLAMTEGPFDTIVVITDISLVTQNRKVEAGLPSELCRIVVLSTRKLTVSQKGKALRDLFSSEVTIAGTNLLLHLFGHIYGLDSNYTDSQTAMKPFNSIEEKPMVKDFNQEEKKVLRGKFAELPERELHGDGWLPSVIFHFVMALKHPWLVLRSIFRSRAIWLPLSVPSLATAAIGPTFLLIFTAEIWDVGISMSNRIAVIYALISIVGATVYLINAQSLFLPKQDRNVLTEHLAVANTVIFIAVLLGVCSLFMMVLTLMLLIELYIFPSGLMSTWQTLDNGSIELIDKVRLAAFIATVGVTTGALAAGFDSKAVLRHLRLFKERF